METTELIGKANELSVKINEYASLLETAIREINDALSPVFEDIGLSYVDPKPLCDSGDACPDYHLYINNKGGHWYIRYGYDVEDCQPTEIHYASPDVQKVAAQHLIPFLQGYIALVATTTEEYRKAAEMAQAMANAVKPKEEGQ